MIQIVRSDYTRTKLSENSRNLERFWAAIKCVFPPKAKNIISEKTFVINGIKSTKPNEFAKDFCKFFLLPIDVKTGFVSFDKFHMDETTESTIMYLILFHFGYVSVTEVKQLFKKLKRKKVTGNDHLPPGLHKDSAGVISAPPVHIINISFGSGIFLSEWKIAKILPLYKNGATNTFENYRTLSVIFKVVAKIIYNRLVDDLRSNCYWIVNLGYAQKDPLSYPLL